MVGLSLVQSAFFVRVRRFNGIFMGREEPLLRLLLILASQCLLIAGVDQMRVDRDDPQFCSLSLSRTTSPDQRELIYLIMVIP